MKRPTGNLYTSNIGGLTNIDFEAELWQITRAGMLISKATLVRSLSPSPELFAMFAKKWRFQSPGLWWSVYEERFLQELQTAEKLNSLRLIYRKLLDGKNIVLICFCKDHNYCHRRLVGDFFMQYGIDVTELNPIKNEQITLFME